MWNRIALAIRFVASGIGSQVGGGTGENHRTLASYGEAYLERKGAKLFLELTVPGFERPRN
ncbi:MAG: hypothetical protein WEB58_06780 [Planctomycetaceae bacterium]